MMYSMTVAGIPLHSISKSFVKLSQTFSWILSAAFASSLVLGSSALAAPMPAQNASYHPASAAVGLKSAVQVSLEKAEIAERSQTIYIVQENRHAPLVVYKQTPSPTVKPLVAPQATVKVPVVNTPVLVAKKKPEVQKTLSLIDEMTPEVSAKLAPNKAASNKFVSQSTALASQKVAQKPALKPEHPESPESKLTLPVENPKSLTKNLPNALAEAEASGEIVIIKAVAPASDTTMTAALKPEIAVPAVIKAASKPSKPVLVATASKTNKHQAISKFILQYNRNLGVSAALAIADHILKLSEFHKLDYKMVTSLIAVESGFRPHVVSTSGAVGLGQLKPSTAKTFGVTNLYDPAQNIKAATGYLRMLTNRYGGSLQHALAAYLMGPGAVKRNGVTPSAQGYIRRINQKSAQLSMVLKAHGAN
jgi:soluble lytic murein transglycosylase-like protein